jgi:hypothetical protein
VRSPCRGRAAPAHALDREARPLDPLPRRPEPGAARGKRRVRHQAGEAQPWEPLDELRERPGLLRALDARAPETGVALDEEVDLEPLVGQHA